jgi:hypothetical protein
MLSDHISQSEDELQKGLEFARYSGWYTDKQLDVVRRCLGELKALRVELDTPPKV